ncbi:MAG TPA: DNA polymerase I [Ornithinimicrobium sp.]|nr:DNA polymerase I [Ornithinimicrobium sp.]HKJ11848.1 DNA polymerase I [Ornithinimicrobium sp.]
MTANSATRLLLLDGHSLAYRAFFALPAENFSTSTGQTTNAVYGFVSMLINVLRDEEPSHVAVAFDKSRSTFRTQEYAEYKAGRARTPDEFAGQLPLIREVLDALRIVHLEMDGFEADDIIATLTAQAREDAMEVLICSGDRDAIQLVDKRCTLLYPRKGVSDLVRMTPEAVVDKYGVVPERYSDLAAMVGESSDNLPGVPGVGPKTAAKWLARYEDLAGVVAHVDELSGKAGQAMREHIGNVLRNRKLNQLVDDLQVGLSISDTVRHTWDRDEVHRVFDGLEFRVLRERLFDTLGAVEDEREADAGIDLHGTVLTSGQVAPWLTQHAGAGVRAAMSMVGRPVEGQLAADAEGVAIATADEAAYIDLAALEPADEEALAQWLGQTAYPKAVHDDKALLHALHARGLPVAGVVQDTALAAYLVRPDQRSYDLADLVLRYLHRELRADSATAESAQLQLDLDQDHEDAAQASMVAARAIHDLSVALDSQLADVQGTELLRTVELPLVEVLATMERVGIAVDQEGLRRLDEEFAEAMGAAAQDAWDAIADDSVNLGSPKQLQAVLFDRLGLPKTRRTKTGYTTDAEALAGLYAQTDHPFLEALLRHRDATRLRVTATGLLRSVADDGRIHTTYQQTIAATGRLSSTDPNLQNIPIRTEEGRRLRRVFVVGEGFESLLSADYSQIEMRIMAHLSGDEGLIEAFNTGEDLHRFVGSRVFAVEPPEVTPAMRAKVKAMSYGLAYGLSAFGLSKQLGVSTDEAKSLMQEYFERFGGVRDYLADVVALARSTGFTETIHGRRRYLPDLTSDNRQRREIAERMALNAPIQGSAADIIKIAMLNVARALGERSLRSRVLLQVHDELVLEVAADEREAVESLVRAEMAAAADLDVPLDVSVGVGRTWHEATH